MDTMDVEHLAGLLRQPRTVAAECAQRSALRRRTLRQLLQLQHRGPRRAFKMMGGLRREGIAPKDLARGIISLLTMDQRPPPTREQVEEVLLSITPDVGSRNTTWDEFRTFFGP